MKLFIHMISALCALGMPKSKAAILRPLNEFKRIEVSISTNDLTRIAVQNDRIRSVFGIADEYSLEADEDQGQVFIRPLQSHPLNLTFTTENGLTQDLRLVPHEGPSEALLLTTEHTVAQIREEASSLNRKEVEDLLQACQQNRIPLGYKEVSLTLKTLNQPYPLVGEISNRKLRGLTFEIKETVPLSKSDFVKSCGIPFSDIVAMIIPTPLLKGGHFYVVARVRP